MSLVFEDKTHTWQPCPNCCGDGCYLCANSGFRCLTKGHDGMRCWNAE